MNWIFQTWFFKNQVQINRGIGFLYFIHTYLQRTTTSFLSKMSIIFWHIWGSGFLCGMTSLGKYEDDWGNKKLVNKIYIFFRVFFWFLGKTFENIIGLKNRVWKIKLDEIDFWSIPNLIFTACVACKIQVRNRPKINFVQLDFSNFIFQKSSADQYGHRKKGRNF